MRAGTSGAGEPLYLYFSALFSMGNPSPSGHGEHGDVVSHFVMHELESVLAGHPLLLDDPAKALKQSYVKVDESLAAAKVCAKAVLERLLWQGPASKAVNDRGASLRCCLRLVLFRVKNECFPFFSRGRGLRARFQNKGPSAYQSFVRSGWAVLYVWGGVVRQHVPRNVGHFLESAWMCVLPICTGVQVSQTSL